MDRTIAQIRTKVSVTDVRRLDNVVSVMAVRKGKLRLRLHAMALCWQGMPSGLGASPVGS